MSSGGKSEDTTVTPKYDSLNSSPSSRFSPINISISNLDQAASSPSGRGVAGGYSTREFGVDNNREYFQHRKQTLQGADFEKLTADLLQLNTFSNNEGYLPKRIFLNRKTEEPVLMLELTSKGESEMKQMTLKDLLDYVNGHAKKIDKDGKGYGFPKESANSFKNISTENLFSGFNFLIFEDSYK